MVRANERTDERVAQYLHVDSWLFQTTVQSHSVRVRCIIAPNIEFPTQTPDSASEFISERLDLAIPRTLLSMTQNERGKKRSMAAITSPGEQMDASDVDQYTTSMFYDDF